MNARLTFILVVFTLSFLSWSCEDDVDVNAPWEEKMVIYGILNKADAHHFIKVNKAFLGKGDAMVFAQVSDSLNYIPSDLQVKLTRYVGGVQKGSDIIFHDTIIPNANAGIFAKDNNIIFTSSEKLFGDSEYKLTVTNLKTGMECTSKTLMIDNLSISRVGSEINFSPTQGEYLTSTPTWTSKPNSKVFQMNVRFVYKETTVPGDTVLKSVLWKFGTQKTVKADGGEDLSQSVNGEEFFKYLQFSKDQFPAGAAKRYAYRIEYLLTAGGEELSVYTDVYKPSSNLNQNKPTYTNITNGLGVFSCRYDAPPLSRRLSTSTIDELVNGQYTRDLGFLKCDFCSN